MPLQAIRKAYGLRVEEVLDNWLRFAPPIENRYDAEQAVLRLQEIRHAIYFGLILYNVYNITSLVLLPDMMTLSVVFRALLVTPVSLFLAWFMGRTTPLWTERLVLMGIINAYLLPLLIFWLTNSPLGLFTFGELFLTIAYANMVLTLRYRYAVIFTGICAISSLIALLTKPGLDPDLQLAFSVQILTACAFGLYANYRSEMRRCMDYLSTLEAALHATIAEEARQQSHELSRTDALTELPNRLYLQERLTEWFEQHYSITVMMIDIDFFKPYNDALGHPEGDRCLREIAQLFAAIGTASNIFCARYGGEEFTLAIQGASEADALRLARRVLHGVEDLKIAHPSRPDGKDIVTISIGIAYKPDGVFETKTSLLAAADRALYSAKQQGRNRLELDGEAAVAKHAATA